MTWYEHEAGGPSAHRRTGTVGTFLRQAMSSFLLAELPPPRRDVVQEYVNRGTDARGMGGGFEWEPFVVSEDLYQDTCAELIDAGAASEGTDPPWVDSLFFRRAEKLAVERGTDAHHEIRRTTILWEAASLDHRFGSLDEGLAAELRERRRLANDYDFDSPSRFEPPEGPS